MIILIILACFAAVIFGWTLAPFCLLATEKLSQVPEILKESAQKSEAQSKLDNKEYSTLGLEMFNEQTASKKGTRKELLVAFFVFSSLACALISGYSFFWKLLEVALLLLFWKELLELINPFKKADKK